MKKNNSKKAVLKTVMARKTCAQKLKHALSHTRTEQQHFKAQDISREVSISTETPEASDPDSSENDS